MKFIPLTSPTQLNELQILSESKAQIIFKHSTTCSISSMAKRTVDYEITDEMIAKYDIYYLDLLKYRAISNSIASIFNVKHESPQILIIQNGKCIYHASHSDVSIETALEKLNL